MTSTWRDDRRCHLVTRGNVDGITSAAMFYANNPALKVSFVTSSSGAQDALRRDIQSEDFFIVDLGATDELVHTVRQKAKQGARIHFLDHHQQTETNRPSAGRSNVETVAEQGISAAALAHRFLDLGARHEHLAAIADVIEFCESPSLDRVRLRWGPDRLLEEARILDYSWRLQVDDDHFRRLAARRMAAGLWPSEVPEVKRRYLQVVNEGRWERALEKVRSHMRIRDGLGLLRFGRYRTSLHGFGTRALSHVAREQGCSVAALVNSRKSLSSVSLRGVGSDYDSRSKPKLNLGRFVEDFTRHHGVTGGGHPSSAGAKIFTRDVGLLVQQIQAIVA